MRTSIGLAATASLVMGQLLAPAAVAQPARWGSSGGSWNNGGNWQGGTVRCESWNYRYARCNMNTRGGVRLARVIAGDCRQGRSWGWDSGRNFVWVDRGCRAEFQSRSWGGGGGGGGGGPSTGTVVAGVAVAAGLLAILASKGRKTEQQQGGSSGNGHMAAIEISPGAVPGPAEAAFRRCAEEAARQIGATGGTAIRLGGPVESRGGPDEWQFRIPFQAAWPDDSHATPATCRASGSRLIELNFEAS